MTRAAKLAKPAVPIDRQIRMFYRRKVMLDSDLAAIYGVRTGNLNQAVSRNKERFPDDFMVALTRAEADSLLLQSAIAKDRRGGRRSLPFVFTELGVAMLSSVLTSERAVLMNIEIMRAFVRMRGLVGGSRKMAARIEKLEQGQSRVSSVIEVLVEDIDHLASEVKQMKALPVPRKRRIGF